MQNKHLPQSIPLANNISKNKTKKKRVKYNADFSLLIFCARIFRRVDFRNFPGHSKHDSAAEKFILMRWIIQRNFCDSFHCKLHFGPVKKPELLCWLFRKLLINGGQGSGRAVLLEGGGGGWFFTAFQFPSCFHMQKILDLLLLLLLLLGLFIISLMMFAVNLLLPLSHSHSLRSLGFWLSALPRLEKHSLCWPNDILIKTMPTFWAMAEANRTRIHRVLKLR